MNQIQSSDNNHPEEIKTKLSQDVNENYLNNEKKQGTKNNELKLQRSNNGILRGTTKKVIQVASGEEETDQSQFLKIVTSSREVEEPASIITESKIKPSEFRNKLKQEIQKLHQQQEIGKLNNQDDSVNESNNIQSKNLPNENIDNIIGLKDAHVKNDNINSEKYVMSEENKRKVSEPSYDTNNTKLKEIIEEKIIKPRKIINDIAKPKNNYYALPDKIEESNEKKKEIYHFGRNEKKVNESEKIEPRELKSREYNRSQLRKEYENLKLPSIKNSRERHNMSADLNGYKRCPCLMHNRLYYQEYKKAYLETDFWTQDYWNDQHEIIFEHQRFNNMQHDKLRSESLNRLKLLKRTPWNPAF